jgi:F-type H+-transporting ATPase subunit epsilon
MATEPMHIEVVSAESHVLSADVTEVYARSVEGEIGILAGHQPAVIALDIAPVRVVLADGTSQRIAVHRGTLFVDQEGKVILLADIAELESDIDPERARQKRAELEQRLEQGEDELLRASLAKQNVRLQVVDNTSPADA